jgi:phosphatidylglycerol:prolipoprotein diacylglycerol transferase
VLPRFLQVPFGDLVLHLGGYGFPAFCGVIAALVPALRRAREAGLPRRAFLGTVLLALLGGFAGAKLAAWLQTGTWGGRVLYGGLLGGLGALLLAARALRLPAAATADVLAPPALLAAAFGRLGCLFGGCCHGIPAAFGVAYPRGSLAWKAQVRAGLLPPGAPDSLATLPLPIFEAAVLFGLALLTSRLARTAIGSGRIVAVAGLLYSAWRFVAEFGRGDHGPWAGPLTFSQGVSLVVFAASAWRLSAPIRPAAAAARAEPFRWATAAQVVALLALVALGSGSIGCGGRSHKADDKSREYHGRAKDKAKDYYRRVREEAEEDCADDCADVCCSIVCSGSCEDDEEDDGPALPADVSPEAGRPVSGPATARFRLPMIRPGDRIPVDLDLDGHLNHRTPFALRLAGVIEALPHEPEAVPYRLRITRLELALGALRVAAAPGEVELRLDAQGVVTMGACTLGDALPGVLKALESLTPGLLRLPESTVPAADWHAVLERELSARDAQGHGAARLAWNGTEHAFEIRAWISPPRVDAPRRVQWLVR